MTRSLTRLLTALVAGLLAGVMLTSTAHAEDGFRFWGYYQWSGGKWVFASNGPDKVVPKDGSVEGWRFAVGGKNPRVPRAAGDFATICADAPAESGKKRVALVIDAGTPEDAPTGAPGVPTGVCVLSEPSANGAVVLAKAAQVRIEKGLTCAIDGYPSRGCGDPVKDIKVPATDEQVRLEIDPPVGAAAQPSPAAATDDDTADDGSSLPVIAGVAAVVVLLGAGAYVLSRRRRTPAA
jgi:LPXTG-motif cell wall-anchored protein